MYDYQCTCTCASDGRDIAYKLGKKVNTGKDNGKDYKLDTKGGKKKRDEDEEDDDEDDDDDPEKDHDQERTRIFGVNVRVSPAREFSYWTL